MYVCGHNKTPRHCPYGLLKPLPVLECLWDSISMDFIEKLLDSNGFTAIFVIIDCASKQAIFIPTHDTINSEELPQLFIIHFSPSMVSLTTSLLTVAPSLSPNSHAPLLKPLTWNFTSLPDIIQRPTVLGMCQIDEDTCTSGARGSAWALAKLLATSPLSRSPKIGLRSGVCGERRFG